MKNPLGKRFLRDLIKEKTKYLAIFAFVFLMSAIGSGMLVASFSMMKTYDDGIENYNLEDGHFELVEEKEVSDLMKINDNLSEKITIYEQSFYNFDYTFKGNSEYAIRIYKDRDVVNTESIHEGKMPVAENEIAIDRLFAVNNKINVGDTLKIDGKDMKVTALIALPDYSCLYEKNSDALFNASTFSYGIVSDKTFDGLSKSQYHYGYTYTYDREDITDKEAFNASSKVMEELLGEGFLLNDFLCRQSNKAINFTREDMGSDSAGTTVLIYILIALLGFIFALLTNSTIEKEAKEIGTLRASGYTKTELLIHYITMPILVSLVGFIVGNILGYTVMLKFVQNMYYGSYCLPVFRVYWSAKAFILATVVPLVLLTVICIVGVSVKLQLSPLKFLRGDFSRNGKKKAIKLPNFKFINRFRIRVILQNIPNYGAMIIGIILADILFLFGATMLPILEHHTDNIIKNKLASYQYTLKAPVETKTPDAEKYCISSLVTGKEEDPMDILVYGIEENSVYLTGTTLPEKEGEVVVSSQVLKLLNLSKGDKITVREEYGDNEYTFTIVADFEYPASSALFMNIDNYRASFEKDDNYFTGYLSNEEITDIDEAYIYSVLTEADLTNLSRQMNDSMGLMMPLIKYASIIIFVIVIYLLAKIVLEKNAMSISLSKILGYNKAEIASIYIVSTAIAVVCGIVISIPLALAAIKVAFQVILLEYDIWAKVYVNPIYIIEMVVFCSICFGIISLFQIRKINKIPMEKALKCAE